MITLNKSEVNGNTAAGSGVLASPLAYRQRRRPGLAVAHSVATRRSHLSGGLAQPAVLP